MKLDCWYVTGGPGVGDTRDNLYHWSLRSLIMALDLVVILVLSLAW